MKTRRGLLAMIAAAVLWIMGTSHAVAFPANESRPATVLIVVEGSSSLKNRAMGNGRQLATLLGHFDTSVQIQGMDDYVPQSMTKFDYVFYIGFHAKNRVPAAFLDDLLRSAQPVIWLNSGFREFSLRAEVKKKYGFSVSRLDSLSIFDQVKARGKKFGKGDPNLNLVEITAKDRVSVLATAVSSRTKIEAPYCVQSGNLMYIADLPFASAGEADRYLFFADMLHDILHQDHGPSHSALIRIEDVTPMEHPDRLRRIADVLSSRGVPFLVGVVPFYVNPGEGVRVSLSDKPDVVDALKYMVKKGGTIVMHGVTHQYKGTTAVDWEFWDKATNGPIQGETAEAISRKLDQGIEEFMKNGLYPLVWETPHYTGSFLFYRTVAGYFSTAMEQRLAIENTDYCHYVPYIIYRDLFGQRIYPENLGYIPLDEDRRRSEAYVRNIIESARTNLAVRDGFASCFFHAFVDIHLLEQLVDGIKSLGYTYIDLREQAHEVKSSDRIIITGSRSRNYTLHLNNQYLVESRFKRNGDLVNRKTSDMRLSGDVIRSVELKPGELYLAEPAEYREQEPSFTDRIFRDGDRLYRRLLGSEETWKEARVAILWSREARGAANNDQASLASVFRSVNINVDTIFIGQSMTLDHYNLLIVPYCSVDSLRPEDYTAIMQFVERGGHLITDTKNDLAEKLGITFSQSFMRITRVRDRYFPEERITWSHEELANNFDLGTEGEVFCVNEETNAPIIVGKPHRRGKMIFIATRFDPYSQSGYSMYPYLLEYVRRYFRLGPVVRRDQLEVYFDPGLRQTVSAEQLVKQWVGQGIRIVHAAGWHQYPQYTYDYARLIRLAHANGILVYAWLEPPQVSQKFWLERPEWREKNYKGEDVRPSWRYPVALTDPKCVQRMTEIFDEFLEKYDWDGVNIAELYFEAEKGFMDADLFTPMHPSAQRAVRDRYGITLGKIFDPASPFYWKTNSSVRRAVTEYRVNVLARVYEKLLGVFAKFTREREGFQIVMTAMDGYSSPELREYLGVDMDTILRLQKRFGFLLQVEDPEHLWSSDPNRYITIGRKYADAVGDSSKVSLDLNILSFRSPGVETPFPTLIQTGTESHLLVQAAASGAPRMTIYSEATINPQELMFLPYALATSVRYNHAGNGYEVQSPHSFTLKLPREISKIRVDGASWPSMRDNAFLIPAGPHTITFNKDPMDDFSTHALQGKLLSITGNLLSLSSGMREMTFSYDSDTRTLASFSEKPTSVKVDGKKYSMQPMKGNDRFTIFLPTGKHRVELVTGDPFTYGVNLTSFWTTTAIAIFGSLAVLLLAVMYAVVRVVHRRSIRPTSRGDAHDIS